MTDQYEKRLVEKAKEIMKLREDFELLPDQKKEFERPHFESVARTKIELLLGYILALEESA